VGHPLRVRDVVEVLDEEHRLAAGCPQDVGILLAKKPGQEMDLGLGLPRIRGGAVNDERSQALIGAEPLDQPAATLPFRAGDLRQR
jgi:hypothetical protein